MSFSRDYPRAEYRRLSRSRSPVSRDPRYPRSWSREPSPAWFAHDRRVKRRQATRQMFNEICRSPGQDLCSRYRRDTSPDYGAFPSFSDRRYSSRRENNEFVNRQYNCKAAGKERTMRCDWNGKMKWPTRRNWNGIEKNDNFPSTNSTCTADNSNAPRSPVICSFYNSKNNCEKGDSCKFIHICKYFIENDCKYNRLCKRSHDIFVGQPKRLLQIYDLIPDDNLLMKSNSLEIMASVKEELRKVNSKQSATTPLTPSRQLLDWESFIERNKLPRADTDTPSDFGSENESNCEPIKSPEIDWSVVDQSNGEEGQMDKDEDFIPLEKKSKTGKNEKKDKSKKRKKRKGDRKASKGKLQGSAIKLEPVEENCSDASDTDIDLSITFEYQHPERRFQVRQIENKWQISNIEGEWKKLSVVESEIFNKLSYKGLEIGDKALCRL